MVDGTAVLIKAHEATHDVAMKVDVRMVHRTWDVPVVRRTGGQWTEEAGSREIAMQVAERGKARVLVVVPKVGEEATVLTLAAEAVEIHSEDHSRVVRPAVVIIANHRWLADVAQAARRHSLAHNSVDQVAHLHSLALNSVDRVGRLRSAVTLDVGRSVADRRSPAHRSSRREWDDPSQAVPDRRRSVVRKVDRLSIDHPDVDRTHVATVEMAPLKAVADMELARATDVAEAHRAARRTDVVIDVRTHETAVATDLHPEPTDRGDGDQTAIDVTPLIADEMAMLHETAANADPTEIVDRTHGQTVTVDQSRIDPIGKRRDQLT